MVGWHRAVLNRYGAISNAVVGEQIVVAQAPTAPGAIVAAGATRWPDPAPLVAKVSIRGGWLSWCVATENLCGNVGVRTTGDWKCGNQKMAERRRRRSSRPAACGVVQAWADMCVQCGAARVPESGVPGPTVEPYMPPGAVDGLLGCLAVGCWGGWRGWPLGCWVVG